LAGEFDSDFITFGSTTLTGDLFIAKYDAGGNVLWAKSGGDTYQMDNMNSVAVDASGNAYVAGEFYNPTINFGLFTLTNSDDTVYSSDFFLIKYDANGNVQWAKSAVGAYEDIASSVAVNASGNIYLAGWFDSPTLSFGYITLTNHNSKDTADIFLAKYDTGGNVLWAKSAGGKKGDGASSVAADVSGNAYIAGTFSSPAINFGSTTLTNTGLFLAKYDANGNALWAKSAVGGDVATSVAVDATGESYITGYFTSSTTTFGSTTLTNAGVGNYDIFLAKLSNITGIRESSDILNVSVYPNPAMNNLTIETPQQTVIEILNIQGQLIKTFALNGNKTNIDVSALPCGVYIVEVKTEEGFIVRKFVKE
jgi:hypothetical protein